MQMDIKLSAMLNVICMLQLHAIMRVFFKLKINIIEKRSTSKTITENLVKLHLPTTLGLY